MPSLLSANDRFKLARSLATLRLLAAELRPRDPGRANALGAEADGISAILRDDRERQDLEDAYRECQYHDWLAEQAKFTDADLLAAGGIPG